MTIDEFLKVQEIFMHKKIVKERYESQTEGWDEDMLEEYGDYVLEDAIEYAKGYMDGYKDGYKDALKEVDRNKHETDKA